MLKKKILLSLSCLALFNAQLTLAAPKKNPNERWYQVDMVLFEHTNQGYSSNEVWDLKDAHQATSNSIFLNDNKLINFKQEPVTPGKYSAPMVLSKNLPNQDDVTPYMLLAPQKKKSLGWIRRLERRPSQYRVLFEGSWRQPITNKRQSVPIALQGGDQFGDNFELQGEVLIHVGRYLHIETDLQLNRFQMIDESDSLETLISEIQSGEELTFASQVEIANRRSINADASQFNEDPSLGVKYVITETAEMKQSRRMRSRVIHYIDHPKIGMIIRFEPYDLPEMEQTASAE